MTKKHLIYSIGIILLIIVVSNRNTPNNASVKLEIIQLDEGWGYEIIIDDKKFISQKCIPAIDGNLVFKNKSDAIKVGRLVIRKLENKLAPTITKEDLKDLKLII